MVIKRIQTAEAIPYVYSTWKIASRWRFSFNFFLRTLNIVAEVWWLGLKYFYTSPAKFNQRHGTRFVSHCRKRLRSWLGREWLLHPKICKASQQFSVNVTLVMRKNYDFSEFTRRTTAKSNVWQISHKRSAIVLSSANQVSKICQYFHYQVWNFHFFDSFENSTFRTGTRNSHICGAASVKCYQVAERKLFGESLINGSSNDYVKSFREECACLPACTYIVYDADIDRAKLNWMESLFSNRFQFHKKFG